MSVIPSYLRHLVVEGAGDQEAVRNELLLCQVEAIEEQTKVLERIATALQPDTKDETNTEAMKRVLDYCQDGDAAAATHVLHSALAEGESL